MRPRSSDFRSQDLALRWGQTLQAPSVTSLSLMLSFWAVDTLPYGCVDGSRQRNTTIQCSHWLSSLGLKNAAALSLPSCPEQPECKKQDPEGLFSTLQGAGLPNSHPRTQTNAKKNLELSMHNREAREEAPAGGAASWGPAPPSPGSSGQEGSPATFDLIRLGLGSNHLREAPGTPGMCRVLPTKQVYACGWLQLWAIILNVF